MQLYSHPPRNRRIKLPEGFNPLSFSKYAYSDTRLHKPSSAERDLENQKDGYLSELIDEVLENGFEKDITLNPFLSFDRNSNSILKIVDDKLEHPRHISLGKPLNRAEMLALILYSGASPPSLSLSLSFRPSRT